MRGNQLQLCAEGPTVVRRLHRYQAYIDQIFSLSLLVLELNETRFRESAFVRSRYGLLTTDSLILAAAELYDIEALATRDDDFDEGPVADSLQTG